MVSTTAIIWVFCINYTICGLFGLIANSALLLKLYRKRKESTVFNRTLASLSISNIISDICFLVSGCIFVYHFIFQKALVDKIIVYVLENANRFAMCVSFSHIIFITIQRLAAISFPFRFRRVFTTRVVCIILVLIWIEGFAAVSLYQFLLRVDRDPDKQLSLFTIIVGSIFLISYVWIFYRLLKRGRISKTLSESNHAHSDTSNNILFINSLGLTLMFIVFMFPYAIFVLSGSTMSEIRMLFSSLLVFKTICDPLVYFFIARCKWIRRREVARGPANAEMSIAPQDGSIPNSQKNPTISL